MKQKKIKELNPEERKKVILQLLGELTQRRDTLEEEIKQLCNLWDETVSELNGKGAAEVRGLSSPNGPRSAAGTS